MSRQRHIVTNLRRSAKTARRSPIDCERKENKGVTDEENQGTTLRSGVYHSALKQLFPTSKLVFDIRRAHCRLEQAQGRRSTLRLQSVRKQTRTNRPELARLTYCQLELGSAWSGRSPAEHRSRAKRRSKSAGTRSS
eukprot:6198516-Pleurochrysis_carterae.AAC.2